MYVAANKQRPYEVAVATGVGAVRREAATERYVRVGGSDASSRGRRGQQQQRSESHNIEKIPLSPRIIEFSKPTLPRL